MKTKNSTEHRLMPLSGNTYSLAGLHRLAAAICKLPEKYVDNRARGCKNAAVKIITPKKDE